MDLLQMMQCSEGCKNMLPIAEFNKPKKSLCKKCVLKKKREAYALKKSIEKSQGGDIFIETRKCNDEECQKMLPITEFRMTLKKDCEVRVRNVNAKRPIYATK